MSFVARFRGRCPRCDEPIEAGERVEFNDEREVVHTGCEEKPDPDSPRRTERRCPDCWTWHAGECA